MGNSKSTSKPLLPSEPTNEDSPLDRESSESAEKDTHPLVQECLELRRALDAEKNRCRDLNNEIQLLKDELQNQVVKNEEYGGNIKSLKIANTTGSASGGSASLSTQACIPPPPIEDHPPPPVHPKPPVAEKKPRPHVASKIANTTGSASGGSASLSTQACIPPPPIEDHPPPPVHTKPPVAEKKPRPHVASKIANTTGSASGGSASLSTQACIPPPPIEDHPPPPVHTKPPVAEKKPRPHVASKEIKPPSQPPLPKPSQPFTDIFGAPIRTKNSPSDTPSIKSKEIKPPSQPPLPKPSQPFTDIFGAPIRTKNSPSDTPSIKSKETVTEVQKSLEIQASKWQERIKAKDVELKQIKAENLALVQEIQRSQADSQKILDITLKNAESSRIYLEDKYSAELSSSLLAHQTETKECLERICPSVSIDSSLSFPDWLNEYQIQAAHLRQRKVLVLGLPPEQRKQVANKESQYEDFPQQAKKIGCNKIEHLKIEDAAFHPIKKAKSLGSLTTSTEPDKNMKRKRNVLEENLRLNMLATENLDRLASCTLCSEIARKCLLNPVRILLNYTEWNDNNQFTVIIDTNVMVDHMKTVELLMGTVINERLPVLMIPYIVSKEVDKISKNKSEKKKLAAYLARQAMKKIAELMRQNPRIVEQTLEQMKACTVWKSKRKDNDDLILECCIDVQKSGHNAILWSEDKNLRIKTLGHRIMAFCTKDICEIISTKSINPLDTKMRENENIKKIFDIMKDVPAQLVDEMRHDPKNAIDILTKNQGIITHPSIENKPLVESNPGPLSDVEDVEISLLFELPKESSWTQMEDGNFCIDDGDDDLY